MTNVVEVQVSSGEDWCTVYRVGTEDSGWLLISNVDTYAIVGDLLDLDKHKAGHANIFRNVVIPKGAIIKSAYFSVECLTECINDCLPVKSYISGEKNVNPNVFTTLEDYKNRRGILGGVDNRTNAKVYWEIDEGWYSTVWYNSIDIKEIIQEIVNLPDWESGCSITLFWDDHDGMSGNNKKELLLTYNLTPPCPEDAVILHIEWEEAPTPPAPTNPITAIVDAIVSVFSMLFVVLSENAETLARLFLYGLIIAGFVKSIRKTYGGFRGLIQWR